MAKKTPKAKKLTASKTPKKPAKKAVKKAAPKKAVKKAAAKKAPAKKATKKAASKPAAKKAASKKAAKKPATKATKPKAKTPPKETTATEAPASTKKTAAPSSAFVKKQQQRLLDLRDELMDTMYGMKQETLNAGAGADSNGSGMHTGDAGSDAYDRDLALTMLANESDALAEIEAALQRIEEGTYGICQISGEKIPRPRLEAIPFARLTVEMQAQWEKENEGRRFQQEYSEGFGFDS